MKPLGLYYAALQGSFGVRVKDAYECLRWDKGHLLLVSLDVFAVWARQGVGWYVGLSWYVNDLKVVVL